MLRAVFNEELAGVLSFLEDADKRLDSLHALAEHDELPMEVVRRIGTKRSVIAHAAEALAEVPQMVAESGGGK
jgi:hypothetical protein